MALFADTIDWKAWKKIWRWVVLMDPELMDNGVFIICPQMKGTQAEEEKQATEEATGTRQWWESHQSPKSRATQSH